MSAILKITSLDGYDIEYSMGRVYDIPLTEILVVPFIKIIYEDIKYRKFSDLEAEKLIDLYSIGIYYDQNYKSLHFSSKEKAQEVLTQMEQAIEDFYENYSEHVKVIK